MGYDSKEIIDGIEKQLKNGRYERSTIYGDGNAGKKIVAILAKVDPPVQKHIVY